MKTIESGEKCVGFVVNATPMSEVANKMREELEQ